MSITAFIPSFGAPNFIALFLSILHLSSSPIAAYATALFPRASELFGSIFIALVKFTIACSNSPIVKYAVPKLN